MQIPPMTAAPPDPIRLRAQQLETAFLSQMLAFAGLGTQENSFGGGVGEGQFASFLRDEQARLVVEHGGIGLTERLVRAMGGQDGQA